MKSSIPTEPPELIATRRWVEEFVVGLGLCPFAGAVVDSPSLSLFLCDATQSAQLLELLHQRLLRFANQNSPTTELIVHPHVLTNFDDYNQFLDVVDHLLEDLNLLGVLQVASFHPDYCFAGCDEQAPENYSNRSPYPMLHILREDSVSQAVDSYPNVDEIPLRNIATLKQQSHKELAKRLSQIRRSAETEKK